jgi:hypothetical protein
MSHICAYCKTEFSSKSYLNYHQKRTKYCLEIQGNHQNAVYKCKYCDKTLSSEKRLKTHYEICNEYINYIKESKYKEQINILTNQLEIQREKYEKIIQQLQDKIENIAIKAVQRPTTTNNMNKTQINNYIQNMQPITSETMSEHTNNLTIEHVQKGASGYAEYALEYPLKDRVACVDYSRRKLKFTDPKGNIITDPEMVKLAPMFFESIKAKSSELVYGMNTPDMDSAMFEEVAKLFNINADVKNGSSGIKTEFYHDFIKHVCSGSVVE